MSYFYSYEHVATVQKLSANFARKLTFLIKKTLTKHNDIITLVYCDLLLKTYLYVQNIVIVGKSTQKSKLN